MEYINLLFDLPEFTVKNVREIDEQTVMVEVEPTSYVQPCPICHATEVIRRGTPYSRKVQHLSAFGKEVYLQVPAIRMSCNKCTTSFVWEYESIAPKKRYTKVFVQQIPRQVMGSTVAHASSVLQIPNSSVTEVYNQWMDQEAPRVQQECIHEAIQRENLVLGIDDFAIRKGHRYNTGLHDLRGETFLDIIPGRTMEELRAYYETHPALIDLQPVAVVMDLARSYHSFVQEVYPDAIRIADRFHVNRYVTEALQQVRKEVQNTLPPRARKRLKENHKVLGKRKDDLSDHEHSILEELFRYSSGLREVYLWKESFIEWYDCSSSWEQAKILFDRWCEEGRNIPYSAVQSCLKTMENWKEEICNYHRLRFTNASVEGRNNKIKALQRRHYFTRNPIRYKQRILLECNHERVIS